MKKLLSLLLVAAMLLCCVPGPLNVNAAEDSQKLYLKPNANWLMDGARFALYYWNASGDAWADMADEDGDGYYEVEIPAGYTNVIFCRMNPSATANNWDNKWNQTGDLTVPTDGSNCYTVPDGNWNDADNTNWSVYTPEEEEPSEPVETEPAAKEYYLYGYIGYADVSSNEHKFVDGKLTITFTAADNYIFVKDNQGNSYMTDGWLGTDVNSAVLGTAYASGDKLYVAAGEYELTLTEHDDGTLTLDVAKVEEEEPVVPEEEVAHAPVEVIVHYTREDGNFDGWDVFQWGGVSATAFEKVSDTEAVSTITANSNSGDIGFIVRYGGDNWTDREWSDEGKTTGDRMVTGLSDIVTGTVHVYVDHANPAETKIELGDDVIYTGDEHININVHYIREDGNFDGWDVFQWGGQSATAFEQVSDTEAVSTICAYSNSSDVGFIVRYGGDNWTDREWSDEGKTTGDRIVSGLSGIYCGTVDVYVDHANPTETKIVFGTVAYGTGEEPEYDIEVQVHYYRADGDYTDWEVHMWNGVESLSSTRAFEDDEVTYDGVTYAKTATYYADASDTWVGFIIKKPDWTKDPDGDRKIDISDVTGGVVHVYAISGSALEDFATDKSEATLGAKITAAVYDQSKETLTVTVSYPLDEEATVDTFTLEGPDGEMTITAVEAVDEYNYLVSFEGEITEDDVYTVYFQEVPCVVTVPNLYSTEEWEAEYTYAGDDLGATWTAEGTTFRLWAPTASAVSVNLYTAGNDGEKTASVEMTPDVNGTWIVTVEGDLNGIYYTYSVTRKGETVEAVDPYARTTGVNGNRGMVVDLDSTDPTGWENDTYVTQSSYTDAVIWELHVRDFSINENSGMTNKGQYLAFTELGTTVPGTEISTGVDYMVDLGVNYVHLLPVYDINSVDETTGGYNWGYDPKNYNVPEGSYSTDPYNGAVRVTEFKQMVQSLHNQGIGVIMDVVYNHVADAGTFCFNQIVPGYFSRIHDDGSYQSNSGCGNDTASERSMVRKYIVDSVLYWAEEYHIDGFRWDLVGLIDYETINEVMEEVHKVNPDIIFYGEGWEMCTWTTKDEGAYASDPYSKKMTIQPNDHLVNTEAGVFAFFNDTIRNVIHGGVFTATDKGFVSGNMDEGKKSTVTMGYMGNSNWGSNNASVDTPLQTINYASCHDNYTLFDNLTIDVMDATGVTAAAAAPKAAEMNNLAAAYYITAQGVPFIHAGEEMLRSKPDSAQENGFNHNSYASGDEINSFKWGDLANELNADTYEYYKGLIAFRKAHPALRMTTEAEVLAAMSVIETGNNNVIAILNAGGNGEDAQIISIFNADSVANTVTLPEGEWNVYVNKADAGTEVLATVSGTVEVEATSAMILVAHVHAYEAVVTAPTCTETGCTTYTCSVCGDSYTEEIAATGHNYEAVVTAPTCTEAGCTTYTCSVCGDSYTEEIAATGHNYEAVVTAPTCTEAGYTTYTCSACGDSYVGDETEAAGHTFENGICTACGKEEAQDAIDQVKDWLEQLFGGECEHVYSSQVKDPTCTEVGYTVHTCEKCGVSYADSFELPTGHSFADGECKDCGAKKPSIWDWLSKWF